MLREAGVWLPRDHTPRWEAAARLRAAVEALAEAEAALVIARHPLPAVTGGVPQGVWIAMLGVGLLALVLLDFFVALAVCALGYGGFGLAGLAWYLHTRRLHAARLAASVAARDAAAELALLALRALVDGEFTGIIGRTLVEWRPQPLLQQHRDVRQRDGA